MPLEITGSTVFLVILFIQAEDSSGHWLLKNAFLSDTNDHGLLLQ